jgi:hypothetical protein
MGVRPAGEGRGLETIGQRRLERVVRRDPRREDGRHDHEQQHRAGKGEVDLQEDIPAPRPPGFLYQDLGAGNRDVHQDLILGST